MDRSRKYPSTPKPSITQTGNIVDVLAYEPMMHRTMIGGSRYARLTYISREILAASVIMTANMIRFATRKAAMIP